MIDQLARFYDSFEGKHNYSRSKLENGVDATLKEINFDIEKFIKREGNYQIKTIKIKEVYLKNGKIKCN